MMVSAEDALPGAMLAVVVQVGEAVGAPVQVQDDPEACQLLMPFGRSWLNVTEGFWLEAPLTAVREPLARV